MTTGRSGALDVHHLFGPNPNMTATARTSTRSLLSYLDTVIQGYLTEFGEAGARRFFDTTAGWEAPVFDRIGKEPVYSRVTRMTSDERSFVDDELRLARPVRRITSL